MEGLACIAWLIGVAVAIYYIVMTYRAVTALEGIHEELEIARQTRNEHPE